MSRGQDLERIQQFLDCKLRITDEVSAAADKKPPLLFTFVCDTSGSMKGQKIDSVYEEIKHFINEEMGDNDRMEMLTFGDEAKKQFGLLKKNKLRLDKIKEQLSPVGRSTALYDGIGKALNEMPRNSIYNGYQREMIVLTDGKENSSSTYTFDTIKEKIAHPGIENFHLMIIGVGMRETSRTRLEELCSQPIHAKYVDCSESRDAIKSVFRKAAKEIRQHSLEIQLQLKITNAVRSSLLQLDEPAAAAATAQPSLGSRAPSANSSYNQRPANGIASSTSSQKTVHNNAPTDTTVPPSRFGRDANNNFIKTGHQQNSAANDVNRFKQTTSDFQSLNQQSQHQPGFQQRQQETSHHHRRAFMPSSLSSSSLSGNQKQPFSFDFTKPAATHAPSPTSAASNSHPPTTSHHKPSYVHNKGHQAAPTPAAAAASPSRMPNSTSQNKPKFAFDLAHAQQQPTQPKQQRCKHSFQCKHGLQCRDKHYEIEKEMFIASGGKGIPGYKARACDGKCNKTPSLCTFAHTKEDSVCYKCDGTVGHLNTDRWCPNFGK